MTTLNIANILALRDFIAETNYEFCMDDGYANLQCGSAGCIGGHAAVLWLEVRANQMNNGDLFTWDKKALAEKLGISVDVQHDLCYPEKFTDGSDTDGPDGAGFHLVTRAHAIDALTRLAETGKVEFRRDLEGGGK